VRASGRAYYTRRSINPPGEPRKKIKTVTTRRAPGGLRVRVMLHPPYSPYVPAGAGVEDISPRLADRNGVSFYFLRKGRRGGGDF